MLIENNELNKVYYFFRVIEKHANIEWSEKVLERLNYYLKKTDLDALDKFNENQTLENFLQQSYSTLRGHGIHALTKLIENSATNILYFKDTILSLAKDKTDYVRMNSIVLLAAILDIDEQFAKELFELIFDKDERMLGHWHSNYILYRLYDDYKERIDSFLKLGFTSTEQLIVKKASSLITEIYLNTGEMESTVYGGNGFQAESICEMAVNYLKRKNHKEKAKEIILHYLSYDNIDFPEKLTMTYKKVNNLRYGENPFFHHP